MVQQQEQRTRTRLACVAALAFALFAAGCLWLTQSARYEKNVGKKRTFMDLCGTSLIDEVREALQNGASPHAPSPDDLGYGPDSTPLMVSVGNGTSVEIVRLLLQAGADPNRETSRGQAPLDIAPNVAMLDALQAGGAWLVGKNVRGVLRARGLMAETAHSETRFFLADDPAFLPPSGSTQTDSAHVLTPLQQRLLAFVVQQHLLQQTERADQIDQTGQSGRALTPGYSTQIAYRDDVENKPVAFLLYHFAAANGAFVVGRTDAAGRSARLYTAHEEDVLFYDSEGALLAAEAVLQPEPQPEHPAVQARVFHGERLCFVDAASGLPARSYPYMMLSDSGVALAGTTGELGCSPELFVPAPSAAFRVFGGTEAVRMNVLEPQENAE